MNKAFDNFYNFKGFGPAIKSIPPSQAILDEYKGRLPDRLLEYWQEYGFCGWGDGLFWTVNPEDYEDILQEWLQGTPFEENDIYYVIARSAFGELFVWGKQSGQSLTLEPSFSMIFPTDESDSLARRGQDAVLDSFFACKRKESLNKKDDKDELIFERAVKKLGELSPDEMYGFEPALALGGEPKLENLKKVPVLEHLSFLASLGEKRVMADIVAMSNALPHNQ
ncbi:GAD-like domain-containing protein [Flocculibacter collagenilyticus]|uniref:GAD-like domain-containing protein n=1 Tax=Flocculibacter collagenilyticus TaxID=2744479 RepID=UPI0018F55DA6|nr:GAD-like domain-containing protein [Flocculibacter collagenilyticus]